METSMDFGYSQRWKRDGLTPCAEKRKWVLRFWLAIVIAAAEGALLLHVVARCSGR